MCQNARPCDEFAVLHSREPVFPVAYWDRFFCAHSGVTCFLKWQLSDWRGWGWLLFFEPKKDFFFKGFNLINSTTKDLVVYKCHMLTLEEAGMLQLGPLYSLSRWLSFQKGTEEDGTTWTMSTALNRGRGVGFLDDKLLSLSCKEDKGKWTLSTLMQRTSLIALAVFWLITLPKDTQITLNNILISIHFLRLY